MTEKNLTSVVTAYAMAHPSVHTVCFVFPEALAPTKIKPSPTGEYQELGMAWSDYHEALVEFGQPGLTYRFLAAGSSLSGCDAVGKIVSTTNEQRLFDVNMEAAPTRS